jgi:hypothetical protein
MEQTKNDRNDFLWSLMANPENDAPLHAPGLQQLVNEYPQSGILQALLAYAGEERNLQRAALHFNPALLYKLIHTPSALKEVQNNDVILNRREGNDHSSNNDTETVIDYEEVEPADENIEDETYDEIVGIENISTRQPHDEADEQAAAIEDSGTASGHDQTYDEIVGIEEINTGPGHHAADDEEKLIVENINGTDFFKFDESFGQHAQDEEKKEEPAVSPVSEQREVSKYNDDKMPYTFMWWLDKTRREHAGINQPYIKLEKENPGNKANGRAEELQQQYYQNIFHINTLEELEKNTSLQPEAIPKRKEDRIIERFIQEEPQIKPQSSDKIDNENKAKKSAEDQDELVTETLAAIYTDQMLFHKAIVTYKKLMLKFPEKSRYFVGKIEELEKRTN